jgi:hypothetical protein
MPRLMAKVEGRGNGIKTVVVNMADIATAINRPAPLPTKFFGCELGAQTRWEQDVSARARALARSMRGLPPLTSRLCRRRGTAAHSPAPALVTRPPTPSCARAG